MNLSPNTAVPTASVTIAGANFGSAQGTSTVTFNGTPGTPITGAQPGSSYPCPAVPHPGTSWLRSVEWPATERRLRCRNCPALPAFRHLGYSRHACNDYWCELRVAAGHEHGNVQRDLRNTHKLEPNQHRGARTERSNYRHRRRHGRGQPAIQHPFTVLQTPAITNLSTTSATIGSFSDDHRRELRRDTEREYGYIQRDRRNADKLGPDQHRGTGATGSDDRKCSRNGKRST